MLPPIPTPTSRLLKAAEAEREQLARHRQELLKARQGLRAEIARIEHSLDELTERETLLDRLVGVSPRVEADVRNRRVGPGLNEHVGAVAAELTVLRGPDIRREAVRVLLAHPAHPEALHYRDWYALLQESGFAAGGKDPLATFLTQLSRSPAVRRSTQAGVYELDREALRRLHLRRDDVQKQLRTLTTTTSHGADGAAVRARRTQLNSELSRIEKAIEEVDALFAGGGTTALAA